MSADTPPHSSPAWMSPETGSAIQYGLQRTVSPESRIRSRQRGVLRGGSRKMVQLSMVILAALLPVAASAQQHPDEAGVKQEAGDCVTLGKITVDKRARTIRFPARVNLAAGRIEYLLVTEKGKTHESLFATNVSPFQLHVAMLLLGASPAREITEHPREQLTRDSLKIEPELEGDEVNILVSWKQGDTAQKVHAEEWIYNDLSQAPMTAGPWIYTGSAIFNNQFLAQADGSIIALVTDRAALINNPRPGHDDDTIWSARSTKVPAVDTPVEITFQLLKSKNTTIKKPEK